MHTESSCHILWQFIIRHCHFNFGGLSEMVRQCYKPKLNYRRNWCKKKQFYFLCQCCWPPAKHFYFHLYHRSIIVPLLIIILALLFSSRRQFSFVSEDVSLGLQHVCHLENVRHLEHHWRYNFAVCDSR